MNQPNIKTPKETKPQNKDLNELLKRTIEPIDLVKVKITLNGLYSIPNEWKERLADGTDTNIYSVELLGVKFENGKFVTKKMTEEELKQAEEDKKGKKAPAKVDKKGKKEEPSPEEIEKKKKEEEERVEKERKLKEEWDSLDEETKLIRISEDIYKSPYIKFNGVNEEGNDLEPIKIVEKKDADLVVFEEMINDEKGAWMVLSKVPPPEPDDPKLKKKPNKKGVVEVENPVFGKAWIKLDELIKPGGKLLTQRCSFQIMEIKKSEGEEEKEDKKEDKKEKKEDKKEDKKEKKDEKKEEKKAEGGSEVQDIFLAAKTYAYISIETDPPINHLIPAEPLTVADDLVKQKPPLPKYPTTKDPTELYSLQMKIALEALFREYQKLIEKECNELSNNSPDQAKCKKLTTEHTLKKSEFINELNNSGKYFTLKEKLKKSIARIVRDKFMKKSHTIGLSKDENDQFYSELYAYLIQHMHQTLHSMVDTKKIELQEEIVATSDIAKRELDQFLLNINKETKENRFLRLCREYERVKDYEMAEQYVKKAIELNEREIGFWFRICKIYKKKNDIVNAEISMKEALGISNDEDQLLKKMGCLYAEISKFPEAGIMVKRIISKKFENIDGNLFLALIYSIQNKLGLANRHFEIAYRQKLRESNRLQNKGTYITDPNALLIIAGNQLNSDEKDNMYYEMIDFLLKERLPKLTEKSLDFINNKESTRFLLCKAKLYFIKELYNESLDILNKLLILESRNQNALKLKGHCLYYLSKYAEAEDSYLRCIRIYPPPKSKKLYLNLGFQYMNRNMFREAQVVFLQSVQNFLSAFSWKYLGLSYFKLNILQEAEKALNKACALDNTNGEIWASFALICLLNGKRIIQSISALKVVFQLKYKNDELFMQLGSEFEKLGEQNTALECYNYCLNSRMPLLKKARIYLKWESEKDKAVNLIKTALDIAETNDEKNSIIKEFGNLIGIAPSEKEEIPNSSNINSPIADFESPEHQKGKEEDQKQNQKKENDINLHLNGSPGKEEERKDGNVEKEDGSKLGKSPDLNSNSNSNLNSNSINKSNMEANPKPSDSQKNENKSKEEKAKEIKKANLPESKSNAKNVQKPKPPEAKSNAKK